MIKLQKLNQNCLYAKKPVIAALPQNRKHAVYSDVDMDDEGASTRAGAKQLD